ncbi:hypothetical protein EK21DRAFT_69493 [Setomelanomma holmii]|uniref:Uncharacterized protein n=1 Tax=Setomelanomma holmii TaxID=210430 RepID=A0A9P4H6N2_9PLEO|nr:hypothetical protein EK21DRAFT_69493 [Setomelanomma holmii]
MLYEHVGLEHFMNLALVIYPTLLRHRLVPELTPTILDRIIREVHIPAIRVNHPSAAARMPVELWLQIARQFEPANSIALIFALGPWFWQLSERPSRELLSWLRTWSRRSTKGRPK